MRRTARSAAVAALVAAVVVAAAPAALAKPHKSGNPGKLQHKPAHHKVHETAEHALVHWINVQRQQRGLRPLAPSAQLTKVAHVHTDAMVHARKVWHDGRLSKEVTGWQRLGEDVGKAGSLASMEYALLNTPANRQNILGADFRDVGVGTGGRDGSLYVTVLVRQPAPAAHH